MTGPVVILAHATDSGAESVAACLVCKFGSRAVRIVRPETLSLASWSHRVNSNGRATTRLTLPNAEPIDDGRVAAVLNRIRYLPVPRFHRSSTKDRDYACVEMQALVASWLAGFGTRVVHVVREHPWVTPVLPLQHWAQSAAACGLPVAVRTISSSPRALRVRSRRVLREPHAGAPARSQIASGGTVLVAGNRANGHFSAMFGPQCLHAARVLGFPLLEFRFSSDENGTVLTTVDPLPSLVEPWAAALTVDLLESIAGESSSWS